MINSKIVKIKYTAIAIDPITICLISNSEFGNNIPHVRNPNMKDEKDKPIIFDIKSLILIPLMKLDYDHLTRSLLRNDKRLYYS